LSHFTAYLAEGPDGACRVKLAGQFDFSGRELADEVLASVNGARKIVLDLSELEFIDSMGIHFVVTAHERARAAGREFTILRGGPQVERVFNLVGLDDVLPFADAP
jgi:anti-anti-sigma factor